jgi:hypothetical protein
MRYRCSKCKQVYERDSGKAWIKSYCNETDQYARLIKEKRDMQLSQMEQEAVVVEQLEWLIKYELKHDAEDQDWELINALTRVLKEFEPINFVEEKS